jgi:2,4-dichlorophenol 6-monooxygenase
VRRLNLPFLRIVVTGSPEAQDLYCEWQRVREIEEAGALLVRPDGVVAWRDKHGALEVQEAAEKLSAAIRAVLDLPNLSAIPREKQPEPSTHNGTPLFA